MRPIPRSAFQELVRAGLRVFPAVAILGPRQCGKSTLARRFCASYQRRDVRYFDLESLSDLNRLAASPEEDLGALQRSTRLIVIDEAQRAPSLFPLLRVLLDSTGRRARYLLLGSASFGLVRGVSESLAGRIGFIDLTPLLAGELGARRQADRARQWLRGGFPRSLLARSDAASAEWRRGYYRTFLEQDVPNLGFRLPPVALHRFWTMLAHVHGGQLNASEIAAGLGISTPTVFRYLDLLEGTFMIRRLAPFWANVGKRLVKAPKLYLRDTGLLHGLLGVQSLDALRSHPKVGASWEGWVLEQILGALALAGEAARPYFWRTHGGAEVDLLLEWRGGLTPVEIKMSGAPRPTRGLLHCMSDLKAPSGFVVHSGADFYPLGQSVWALPADLLSRPETLARALLRPATHHRRTA